MAWDFETEPEFQMHLDWMDRFVRDEVEPLDLVLRDPYDVRDARMVEQTRPLMQRVKAAQDTNDTRLHMQLWRITTRRPSKRLPSIMQMDGPMR